MVDLRAVFCRLSLCSLAVCTACTPGGPPAGGDSRITPFEATIGPFIAAPGSEKTQCIVFRLRNPDGAFIRRIRAELGNSSHHMTLYTSAEITERRTPFDCAGFDSLFKGDRPLFIAQQHRSEILFPDDESGVPVGYAIAREQMVRLEMHYLNTGAKQTAVAGRFFLDTIPLSSRVTETDIAFWGTTDIQIPPNSTWETKVRFVQAIPDTRTFALTTHQHRLGTRMRVWHANDSSDTADEPVADCTSWSDPPLEMLRPPLVFGEGGKAGLAYKCEWTNPTPKQVNFGEGFNDEMCFLWHYYYPGQGFSHIVDP